MQYYLHNGLWGWWEYAIWFSEQYPISISSMLSLHSWEENMSPLLSTIFKILWKAATSQGILSTPVCWNPNSSSASLRRIWNAWWPKYSVGIVNLLSSSPTQTARYPLGTTLLDPPSRSDRERVLFRNFMLLLVVVMEVGTLVVAVVFEELASLLHFLRICWSLTISLILLDFFRSIDMVTFFSLMGESLFLGSFAYWLGLAYIGCMLAIYRASEHGY